MKTIVKFIINFENSKMFFINGVINERLANEEIRIPNIGEEYSLYLYNYLVSFTDKKELVNRIFPRDEGESFKEYKIRLKKACHDDYMKNNSYESFLAIIVSYIDSKLYRVSRIKHLFDMGNRSDIIEVYLNEIPNKQYWE